MTIEETFGRIHVWTNTCTCTRTSTSTRVCVLNPHHVTRRHACGSAGACTDHTRRTAACGDPCSRIRVTIASFSRRDGRETREWSVWRSRDCVAVVKAEREAGEDLVTNTLASCLLKPEDVFTGFHLSLRVTCNNCTAILNIHVHVYSVYCKYSYIPVLYMTVYWHKRTGTCILLHVTCRTCILYSFYGILLSIAPYYNVCDFTD